MVKIKAMPVFDYDCNRWNLRIQVRDTGCGIKQQDQIKIFRLFDKVTQIEQHRSKGIGFGLVASKSIVDEFEGEIILYSKPGMGSLFQFNFYLEDLTLPDLFLEQSRSIDSEDEDLLDNS
jgi:K+-sensing histidine kinase KdpD